jgi:predicted dinucleotide-binding enzyme
MTIGIIGSDDRAVALGKLLRRSGQIVCFSDPMHKQNPASAAHALGEGAFASTPYRQAATCDTLLFMVHWEDLESTLSALGSYKDGIVIDATRPPDLGEKTSGAELLAHKLDNRHIVKAFVESIRPGDRVKVAADDPEARDRVDELISACGCTAENIGPLANARTIERDVAPEISPHYSR